MISIHIQPKKIVSKTPLTGFIAVALLTILIACSGGSTDSGGSSANAGYSGSTERAAITSENSGTLIKESFQGALTGNSMMPLARVAPGNQNGAGPSVPIGLQAAFSGSLTRMIDTSGDVASDQRAATSSTSGTIEGDCGGTATYTVSANQSTGVFSGSFKYSSFCSGEITLSGNSSFSGRIDTATQTFDYFTFTFSSLTMTADSQSSTLSGSLECYFVGTDISITADLVVNQASSDQICWLNDYQIQINGDQMDISGRFYHPQYGYIDFITEDYLILTAGSQYPLAGTVLFTGETGEGGQPTQARLSAISATTCRITADYDGDGDFEYDSGEILWSDL